MSFVPRFLGSASLRASLLWLRLLSATMTLLTYLSLSALLLWKCSAARRGFLKMPDGTLCSVLAVAPARPPSALLTQYMKQLLMTFPGVVQVTFHTSLQ